MSETDWRRGPVTALGVGIEIPVIIVNVQGREIGIVIMMIVEIENVKESAAKEVTEENEKGRENAVNVNEVTEKGQNENAATERGLNVSAATERG